MIQTYLTQALRVRFPVVTAGALVPGLLPAAFTVVVQAPSGVTTALAVAESGALGTYYLDIPATFWANNGVGAYSVIVSVAAPNAQVFTQDVLVLDELAEVLGSVTYDAGANQIRAHLWLQRSTGVDLNGLQNATARLYDRTGAALSALQTTASPDAQGMFAFNFGPGVAFPVGDTETYLVVALEQVYPAATSVRTYTGRVGVTFSRTS